MCLISIMIKVNSGVHMENIAKFEQEFKLSWFEKRCRKLVFSVLNKLDDKLEVIEAGQVYTFGSESVQTQSSLHGQIIIHDPKVYAEFVKGGSIGVAEAFIENRWSSPNLTVVIQIFSKAQKVTDALESKSGFLSKFKNVLFHYLNRNSQKGAKKNILSHYDLGNELYKRFLDPEMVYSSAIYPHKTATLAEAQLNKLELIS